MADMEKARWAQQGLSKMASLRSGLRTAAARVVSFKGTVNALSAAEKTKLREGLDALGISGADVMTELDSLETLANTILTTVEDTKNI